MPDSPSCALAASAIFPLGCDFLSLGHAVIHLHPSLDPFSFHTHPTSAFLTQQCSGTHRTSQLRSIVSGKVRFAFDS